MALPTMREPLVAPSAAREAGEEGVGTVAPLRAETDAALAATAAHAAVGLELPPMSQLRGWKRWLVVPFARQVLRVAQLVTHGQRAYNQAALEGLTALADRLQLQERRLVALERRVQTETSLLAQELASLDAVVALCRDEGAGAAAAAAERLGELRRELEVHLAENAPPLDDALYWRFENRFRGGRAEIGQRAEIYLEPLRRCGAGKPERPILEIGSGRGELLQLLVSAGQTARGIDISPLAVEQCQTLGLPVALDEGVAFLQRQPAGSAGAVVALHVVEHLAAAQRVAFVRAAWRVLQPGGVLIVESPNPLNLLVGAGSFYLDPTHDRPLHPKFLEFLLVAAGFESIELLELHPVEPPPFATRVEELVFGPQDFALIGSRPWGG